MKTLIILNIGLETTRNTRVDVHHALSAVAACGVSITTSAVVNGEWDGKPEPCLFVQGFVADPFAVGFRAQLYLASRLLSQHVIALYHDGRGELIGENPEGWEFNAALFHFHPEPVRKPEEPLSECQAIQAEHAERIAAKRVELEGEKDGTPVCHDASPVDGWEAPEQFCAYLEGVLIPDLKDSGYECTAEDFETAVAFIRRA